MARKDPQFNVRMPQELKEMIEVSARDNQRSINAEIIHHLRNAMIATGYMTPEQTEPKGGSGVSSVNDIGRQLIHDVVLTDPNIPQKWNPDFVEEMREVLEFVRKEMKKKG
ncbi:Arc family DNA-binding protein [Aeromonas hydrophila]|uniref:Arc family DNA-binding protein n=1 Tax=Aeromonas hydrophila TaxID=644 RepID=UPI002B4657F5|nr:Arc family DNA-binding protein [Aeromonas hydrophila]